LDYAAAVQSHGTANYAGDSFEVGGFTLEDPVICGLTAMTAQINYSSDEDDYGRQ
jgi:hypothetical protein